MCEMMDGIRSLSARLSVSSARASLTLTLRGASERMLRLAVKAVANLVDKHRLKTGKNQWSKDLSAPDVFLDVFPEHVEWSFPPSTTVSLKAFRSNFSPNPLRQYDLSIPMCVVADTCSVVNRLQMLWGNVHVHLQKDVGFSTGIFLF